MKKPKDSKKPGSKTAPVKAGKSGSVELSDEELKKVSGGATKANWLGSSKWIT